ncbi:MAG: alpha/beta hydrolase [Acidobacteriota bacterium]
MASRLRRLARSSALVAMIGIPAGIPVGRRILARELLFHPDRTVASTPSAVRLDYEDVTFTSADGETLTGFWIPAPERPSLGSVLYCHGNGGNIGHTLRMARLLVDRGFDVLTFDYRGFGRSTGTPSELGTYRDARAAVATLLARPGVDAARVIYVGESLGGAVALELAVEKPPRALVLQSTFTSIRDEQRLHYPRIPRILVPDIYPSVRRIGNLKCPVLIVHGDRDRTVPVTQGRALFEAAPGAKRLEILPGAHHGLRNEEAERYAALVAGWIRALP